MKTERTHLPTIAREDRRAFQIMRKIARKRARSFPKVLTRLPEDQWPAKAIDAWHSQDWLVQIFNDDGHVRITVNRIAVKNDGNWEDRITWDELMTIKVAVGYEAAWAVEVYPPPSDVVNVANMRHLWIVEKPVFAWTTKKGGEP